jgi:hypothetical protein
MKLKGFNTIILLLFSYTFIFGQSEEVDYVNPSEEYAISFDSLKTKDKINYNFEMGMNIGSNGNFGTFYKPSVSYQVSPKFRINTGVMYMNSTVNNYPVYTDYTYKSFTGSISQYVAFVQGKYDLTDRLTVGGSIYYDLTSYSSGDGLNLQASSRSSLDNVGYSANFEYKVSKTLTISGEIRKGGHHSPLNRYQNSVFNSSFQSSFENPFFNRTW